MAKKGAKATRKFANSGELKRTIDARRKHQKIKKQIHTRKALRGGPLPRPKDSEDNERKSGDSSQKGKGKPRSDAIDFLREDEEGGVSPEDEEFMDDEEDEEGNDDGDISSLDDLEDDEAAHKLELSALAEKDPEFYKYLQANDKELLNFSATLPLDDVDRDDGGFAGDGDKEMTPVGDGEGGTPVLTSQILKTWQKAILETRSLRAFRKLLIAFRVASHTNVGDEDDSKHNSWKIENSIVFNKLVVTALKYTPVVLEHHLPYKTLANGKFKSPTQTFKHKTLQKPILSYFRSVIHLISQLSDPDMLSLALKESARVVPYVITSRKAVRAYLKMCLDLWSSAEDQVRISAWVATRKVACAQDESVVDLVLKGTYTTLVRSCKSMTVHTQPSINLMKNSASELYCNDHAVSYQHAFGYIRQLAVHLRNSMAIKSKEAFQQVYNWQFVHSVDFWTLVLGKACDADAELQRGSESELKPLIYPLIQVALGAIRLIPTPRYHPLHLQLIRSLYSLCRHSKTYCNLSPLLLPILGSTTSPSTRPKSSTLRPLDLQLHIRCPAQYLNTRVYAESVAEEAIFLLGSWCESMQSSVAFPEIVLPFLVALKKSLKKSIGGKPVALVKTLLERVEEGVRWIETRRGSVTFAPGTGDDVDRWERNVNIEDTPLGKWMRVQRKSREKKQALVDKAREGQDQTLDEE